MPHSSPVPSPDDALGSSSGAQGVTASRRSSGTAMVLGCYVLWGFFPLFFRLLSAAGSVEIICYRIVWTLATCLLLVCARRGWARLGDVLRSPRLLGSLSSSALLIAANWLIYVYGVNTGRTADAALGYFINPLVTVVLAALLLGERLRRAQGLAITLAGVAVLVLILVQGSLPWISLALALTFGFYGLAKKKVGVSVDALTGLTVESLVLAPAALSYLGWLQVQGQGVMQGGSPTLLALLVLSGPLTAVPLLLFGAGTARVPLSVVGLSQYIAPLTQFLLAWGVFHEQVSQARWTAMVLVWVAVAVFAADLVRQVSRQPRPHQS